MVEATSDQDQLKTVLQYLSKKETRSQALDIILAYTATQENRALFEELDICKVLLRLLPEDGMGVSLKVAQCLINFSTDDYYVRELIKLNVAGRVFDFLKEHVQMNMKQALESNHAAFKEDEKVYEIRQLAMAKTDAQATHATIEHLIMLLTNVTVAEDGQQHIIGEGKMQGLIVENLFSMFCYFLKSGVFDFIANIIANVTALKEGRELVFKQEMLPKILDMLRWGKVNTHRRKHLIDSLRNICFSWQDMEDKFIEMKIVENMGYILAQEEGLTDMPEPVKAYNALIKPTEVNKGSIKNIIDAYLLLSNSDKMMKIIGEHHIDSIFAQVNTKGSEELATNIEVFNVQIQCSRMPPISEEVEEQPVPALE